MIYYTICRRFNNHITTTLRCAFIYIHISIRAYTDNCPIFYTSVYIDINIIFDGLAILWLIPTATF